MRWFWQREDEGPVAEEPFRPGRVDHGPFQNDLLATVNRLLPSAVDEATPHVLDGLIDRYTAVQMARLVKQWAIYQHELMPELIEAQAELAYETVMYEADQRDLIERRHARDAAYARLTGTEELRPQPLTEPDVPRRPEE
ncbi:hypothetical protein ACFQO7_22340 [Catellatospora aurea]|uniref:Uncharacterized protein n=1 Tax=Catellatospora aurea TaxID=1337874 RepID=A0ABW2GZ37_9ACTN